MANGYNVDLIQAYEINNKTMKVKKVNFSKDKWGLYITPLIGYSNIPEEGRTIWVGWLRWLLTIYY